MKNIMQDRIRLCLADPNILLSVCEDFTRTFKHLGLSSEAASALTQEVFGMLRQERSLAPIEHDLFTRFATIKPNGGEAPLANIIDEKLSGRARKIFSQVAPHLKTATGQGLDFGAGDGQVTQLIHDELGKDIKGIDVRPYRAPGVTVPIDVYNGETIDLPSASFAFALATNVFHHAADNESCLAELSRVVRDRLVIIETVPVGDDPAAIERDRERTFMNDYLYNRLFHDADIPVPGTYETPAGWIRRIEQHGWKNSVSQDLGVDLPVIADTHHLLVFDRT